MKLVGAIYPQSRSGLAQKHACHQSAAALARPGQQGLKGSERDTVNHFGGRRDRKDVKPASRRLCQCQSLSTINLPAVAQESVQLFVENTLARDAAATAVALVGGFSLVKTFDYLSNAGVLDKKVSRKLVHILAGPGLMLVWPLFSAAPYARFCAALVPTLNMFRLLLIGTGVVKDEGTVNAVSREGDRRELLRGPLYYVLVLMAATVVYWRDSPIGITAVAMMSGGDGLADLVGRRFGSAKLPHNRQKSWAGTLAMFLGGWGLSAAFIAFFEHLGLFGGSLWAIATTVGGIAAAATLIESLPINQWLDDNLSVPVLAAVAGQMLLTAVTIP